MIKVVFVGDEPSKLNLLKDYAFVGARCFKRLCDWIKIIDANFSLCVNSSQDELKDVCTLHADGFKIIALGFKASQRLTAMGIPHYEMPHPSGRCLKLNDKAYLAACLDNAKAYVRTDICSDHYSA